MKHFKIGRIAGIEIRVHGTFLLFILLAALYLGWGGLGSFLQAIGILGMLFGLVLLHELGHSLVALRFGVRVQSITLLPFGGLAATGAMPRRWRREILIALAGPAVNVLLAALMFGAALSTRLSLSVAADGEPGFAAYFLYANVMLATFNLLPAFPMDGGRVLRALLASRLSYVRATRLALRIGQLFALGFIVLPFFFHEFWMLALIGIFLLFVGRREMRNVEVEDFLRERKAGEFVEPKPWFHGGRDTRFGEICGALAQTDDLAYGVLDLEGLRYGILTRKQMLSACLAMPPGLEARRLIETATVAVPAQLPLYQALPLLQRAPHGLLPVRRGSQIIGVLSLDSVQPVIGSLGKG